MGRLAIEAVATTEIAFPVSTVRAVESYGCTHSAHARRYLTDNEEESRLSIIGATESLRFTRGSTGVL